MDEMEIRMRYRDMAPNQDRIGILADLNGSNRETIIKIVGGTVKVDSRRRKRLDNELLEKLYAQGLNDQEVSQETGYNINSLHAWRYRREIRANWIQIIRFDHDQAMQLYNQGLEDKAIAEALNTRAQKVYEWRKSSGLQCQRKRRKAVHE